MRSLMSLGMFREPACDASASFMGGAPRVRRTIGRICLAFGLASIAAIGGCDTGSTVHVGAVDVRLLAEETSWHASYLNAGVAGWPD